MKNRKLNWRPDPAHKDLALYQPTASLTLPAQTDLEPVSPPCYDQGQMGSCTAHAVCGAFEIMMKVEGHDFGTPARKFVYQMELLLQHTWGQDDGSTIPTGMQAAMAFGLPPEKDYPYSDDVNTLGVQPPRMVYMLGRQRRATGKMEVRIKNDHDHIVAMLAMKRPIACGFPVPQSFMSDDVAHSGEWAGPEANDPIEGGHAVVIVGHDDAKKTYKIRNSWSPGWGKNGYVDVPQDEVHANFSDLTAVVDAPK